MQTYQELTIEVKNVMDNLLFDINYNRSLLQEYFYFLKKDNPEKFERLSYDENGHKPYSQDLEDILFDLNLK